MVAFSASGRKKDYLLLRPMRVAFSMMFAFSMSPTTAADVSASTGKDSTETLKRVNM